MKRIYLDFASATPIHPKAARAMYTASEDVWGNPSATHEEGRRAAGALKDAHRRVARTFSVKPEELLFTSGGTEANNLALLGVAQAMHENGIPYEKMHVVTLSSEHASTLEAVAILEQRGVRATYLVPTFDGLVSAEEVISAVTPETVIVSLAHVNSETGVIQPVAEIARALERWRERGVSSFKSAVPECDFPILHIDAAQSPMYLECGPHALSGALVSYDAQKVMGPKGVGILYRDFSVPIRAILGGGTQERGIRPGTENVPGIIGAAAAFELAHDGRTRRAERIAELRDRLIADVRKHVPEAELIGHPKRRIANNALFAIPGVDGEYLAALMDKEGVSVTPRSACGGSGGGHSHVVFALTKDMSLARGTVRFSLGPDTGGAEIAKAVSVLKKVLPLAKSPGEKGV